MLVPITGLRRGLVSGVELLKLETRIFRHLYCGMARPAAGSLKLEEVEQSRISD